MRKSKAMSYYKAVFDLNRSIEEKAPEERGIHQKMSNNPTFADSPVQYPDFELALNEQQKAVEQARFGGIERISIMRSKEKVVDDMVRQLRIFVTLKADGDTDIILSSGFRHTKPRSSSGEMGKVEGVKNLKSEVSGTLKLKWKPLDNVAFYEVDVREVVQLDSRLNPIVPNPEGETTGPDTGEPIEIDVEKPWKTISSKPSRTVISNLKALTKYEVRVRAKGTKSYGAYSDTVVMVVT